LIREISREPLELPEAGNEETDGQEV